MMDFDVQHHEGWVKCEVRSWTGDDWFLVRVIDVWRAFKPFLCGLKKWSRFQERFKSVFQSV
jgi:hypothetical protein